MEHSQFVILYRPIKDVGTFNYVTEEVDLTAYVDFQGEETLEKSADNGQIPFVRKDFDERNMTYSNNVYTVVGTNPNWKTNKFRWHTLVDKNNTRFRIKSNTSNTITLAPTSDFIRVAAPVSGNCRITIPDFNMDDIFIIYAWKITDNNYRTYTDTDLAYLGQVISIYDRYDSRGSQTQIKLGNVTELLLKFTKRWVEYRAGGTFPTCVEKIKDVITKVNDANKGVLELEWDNSNPSVKSNGSPFPSVDYYSDEKSAYSVIFDLCGDDYTKDGEYYFYIKPLSQYKFSVIWGKKQFSTTELVEEGKDFELSSRNIDKIETISDLIIRSGHDCNNHSITTMCHGDRKNGMRVKFIANNFASGIITKEVTDNSASFDTISETKPLYPLSYPYTTATSVTAEEVANSFGKLDTTGQYTFNNDRSYNKFVRYLSMSRAQIWGKQYLLRSNKLRNKVTCKYYNTPDSAIPATLKYLKIPSIGWTGGNAGEYDYRKILRTNKKTIDVGSNGISLTVEYLEDWELAK